MLALTWRCDGTNGIKWHLRGIDETEAFYGELRFESANETQRKAAIISGQLSPSDVK